jgi:hypothetical protein
MDILYTVFRSTKPYSVQKDLNNEHAIIFSAAEDLFCIMIRTLKLFFP